MLLQRLRSRGLVADVSSEAINSLVAKSTRGPPVVYAGFDPTASSLHLGNYLVLKTLAHLQREGFKPVILVGGATGMIGDPSGKSSDRNLLSDDALEANVAGISSSLSNVVDLGSGPTGGVVINNSEFYTSMSAVELVRDVGRHFRMHTMLARESVKNRLAPGAAGMSFTEFSYQLFQAYDFVCLAREYGCVMQVGGSDQWGNITAGIQLGRAMMGADLCGLTVPLLTTASGEKFGKSAGNAVWLAPSLTSDYQFYQFLLGSTDADVETFLNMLTFLDSDRVAEVMAAHTAAPEQRLAQKLLAEEVTRDVRGEAAVTAAQEATKAMFSGGGGGGKGGGEPDADTLIQGGVPTLELTKGQFVEQTFADVVVGAGLAKSKNECRRLVKAGGLRMNGEKVEDAGMRLTEADIVANACVLRAGKKRHAVVLISPQE